jgi:iron complex outermembrane receptor protein
MSGMRNAAPAAVVESFLSAPLALAWLLVAGACLPVLAWADGESGEPLESVQVTATRAPEPVGQVPASISIVTGDDLRARGANDLRTALSLVVGVEGTPGGDAGPAGSVPALWGLREADAFLLVVDGVPWGGAFNPATPALDLEGVERIEILRGPAPVMYGATAFSGVIHVIHYAPGAMPATLTVAAGSNDTYAAAVTTALPGIGSYQHSLALNFERRGSVDDRTDFQRYHGLYRGLGDLGAGHWHVDADVSILPQRPVGNLLLLDGTDLHNELPIHANYNPDNAKLDQDRYQLALGFDTATPLGDWSSKLAVARTLGNSLRGFLRGNAFADPPDAGVGDGLQADGYSQDVGITDLYFDTHIDTQLAPQATLTYGFDYLYGNGSQDAINFGYCIDEAGQEYDCAGANHADEIVASSDRRDFYGLYAQTDWKPAPRVDVLLGVRLNHTRESASGLAIDNTGAAPVTAFDGSGSESHTRLSGLAGLRWSSWQSGRDSLGWYLDYRNSYKPLAVDFGPEAEVQLLQPETANSYEGGVKLELMDGRLDAEASVFRMDFSNGLTYAYDANGNFGPANGGKTRFQGFELETGYALTPALQVTAHYAYHDAHYLDYTLDDGSNASGLRVEMSPRDLAGLGLRYAAGAWDASLVGNFVGNRMLDPGAGVQAGSYTTVDAAVGYRFGRWRVLMNGYNLGNRRDPVAASELSEAVTVSGTQGFYRLPARSVVLRLSYSP